MKQVIPYINLIKYSYRFKETYTIITLRKDIFIVINKENKRQDIRTYKNGQMSENGPRMNNGTLIFDCFSLDRESRTGVNRTATSMVISNSNRPLSFELQTSNNNGGNTLL